MSQCCEADSLCEEASVVSTRSCPVSKVASSCPCCCHSNRKGLDVGGMGFPPPPFFCVTFSPMMPYSRQSVNQWRSLSFQVKRKNGVSLQLSTFTKPKSLPLYFIDLYQTNCSCKASKNTNLYVYSSMTDILCCSSLAGFSCAAI